MYESLPELPLVLKEGKGQMEKVCYFFHLLQYGTDAPYAYPVFLLPLVDSRSALEVSSPDRCGRMAERPIAVVLKTIEGNTSGGSNPSPSAICRFEKSLGAYKVPGLFCYGDFYLFWGIKNAESSPHASHHIYFFFLFSGDCLLPGVQCCANVRKGVVAMKNLWAPWRMKYILGPKCHEGCVLCAPSHTDEDAERLIVYRGRHVFVMLNRYPYASGHLMVIPYRHVSDITDLSSEESADLMSVVQLSCRVLREVSRPQGINVGLNLGEAAGAAAAIAVQKQIPVRKVAAKDIREMIF